MPGQITADNGKEWGKDMNEYIIAKGGTLTKKNMHAVNTLAVVFSLAK